MPRLADCDRNIELPFSDEEAGELIDRYLEARSRNDDAEAERIANMFPLAPSVARAFMLSSMFDEFLLQHPAVMGTPELKEKADAISDALGDFYQASGVAMAYFDEQADIVVDVSALFDDK